MCLLDCLRAFFEGLADAEVGDDQVNRTGQPQDGLGQANAQVTQVRDDQEGENDFADELDGA